ncbi:MAG: hypothetical protein ACRD8U_12525, partial [Pyrinomonadaceae bacterium]
GKITQARLRADILRRLPLEAEIMRVRGRELADLMRSEPFRKVPEKEARPFVSVMRKAPGKLPRFPLTRPEGDKWEVKLLNVVGQCALSLWRRQGKGMLYPNEVVEKTLGQPSTTRSWNTIVTICQILDD